MSSKLCFLSFVVFVVQVNGEDYFLDDPSYNQTCVEQHPDIPLIYADHDKNYGGCRYICTASDQRFTKDYLMVPNNIPCARGKSCIQGTCHYLTDIANCRSALNSEQTLIKVSPCRLKCSRDLHHGAVRNVDANSRLIIPIFHREGLTCQTLKFNGVCLDGKCVRQRSRSVQPRETIASARTRKHVPVAPARRDSSLYVKIDHYCRERYQDFREDVVGKEVELTRGCRYSCEEPDVWESSEAYRAPDDVPCDPQVGKVCNYGHCRHKEDVRECRISFNTTGAVIVSRIQDFPCSLKCTLPVLSGWRTSYEKRRIGIKCSNVFIRNGVCNKQGICIQEPSY